MAIHYRSQGFIFKKTNRGEADQIFTIYTRDFGKLEILGKAIRKIKSKLRGGAELFYLLEIEFIQGKTSKTLTDAILIEKFENLRKDLRKLKIAYQISEIFDKLIKGQEPDEKIWNLLQETFQKLNTLHLTPYILHLIYYYFLWNLLSLLGYQPELYDCSLCQKKLAPAKLYFSPKEGGVICQNCFKKVKSGKPEHITCYVLGKEIEIGTVKILRILLKKDWPILNRLKIGTQDLNSLKTISNYFLNTLF